MEKTIEIPFGAKDSELKGWEYTIPEDMEAEIKDGKIIVKQKESEDERIRKSIVETIKQCPDTFLNPKNRDRMLAYLERQKERGPLSKDEEYTLTRIIEYLEDNDCPSKWKDLLHDVYSLPYQKEQEPVEWSDEDDAIHTRVLGALGRAFIGVLPTKPSQEDIEWFKSIPERFNLPPKQEWSDLDDGMLNCIIATLCEESHGGRETNEHMVSWLEKLRSRPKTSDSWKPSEEQMRALENVIKCELSAGLHTRAKILQTLQNDLKKL